MTKPIIRYTGSPDSNVEDWLRINHLTEQPGPGSAYRVTIEPIESIGISRALRNLLFAIQVGNPELIESASEKACKALGTEAPNA